MTNLKELKHAERAETNRKMEKHKGKGERRKTKRTGLEEEMK